MQSADAAYSGVVLVALKELEMTDSPLVSNPFALMMDPEAVLRAVEQLQQRQPNQQRRVYRPLDRQAKTPSQPGVDVADYDRAVDDTPDPE